MSNGFSGYFSVEWKIQKQLIASGPYVIHVVKNDKEGTGYFVSDAVIFQTIVKFGKTDGTLLEWTAVRDTDHVFSPKVNPRVYADENKPEYYELLMNAIINEVILEE